jgi:hypothetical protein
MPFTNIDCVSLEADSVDVTDLLVDNVSLTNYTDVVSKSQYFSVDGLYPNVTQHTGALTTTNKLTSPFLSTQSLSSSSLQFNNPLFINYVPTTAFSGTLWSTFCSNMTAGTTLKSRFGYNTSSYNSWEQVFTYVGNANNTNKLDFQASGQTPTLSMIHGKVGVNSASNPTEALDVTGNMKVSGTMTVTGALTSGAFTPSSFFPPRVSPTRTSSTAGGNATYTWNINSNPSKITLITGDLQVNTSTSLSTPYVSINANGSPFFSFGYTTDFNRQTEWVYPKIDMFGSTGVFTTTIKWNLELEFIKMTHPQGSAEWYLIRGSGTFSSVANDIGRYYGFLVFNPGQTLTSIVLTYPGGTGFTSGVAYLTYGAT